jgi:hypothetical protein
VFLYSKRVGRPRSIGQVQRRIFNGRFPCAFGNSNPDLMRKLRADIVK